MRILHISNYFAPIGGIESYLIDLVRVLHDNQIDNVVIYRKEHSSTVKLNNGRQYHVSINDSKKNGNEKIFEIIGIEQPDVIYLHDVYDHSLIKSVSNLAPTIGYVHIFYPVCPGLGKLFRNGDNICTRPYGYGCIPMIYLRRCSDARHPASIYHIMQSTSQYLSAYKMLDRVVVGSKYMKELLIQNGLSNNQIEILAPIASLPNNSHDNLPNDKSKSNTILFVGRLEYEKGLPYLLRALLNINSSYRLIVAGDGSLKHEYTKMAKDLGVSERVIFRNWVSKNKLSHLYNECLVTVMPSLMPEPFGKVGIESFAHGTPVVAFNVGGIPDWLVDGFNGFTIPSRDIESLSEKIDLLLSDHKLSGRLGENGRKFVEENYSRDVQIGNILAIFSSVLERRL